jgi:ABC-type bacteriocin/lantibiotic exporter with double-glycine peptidase domain
MALLRYTVLRVLVFLATAAILWLLGLRSYWLVLFAILLSGFISIVVLSRSRDAASIEISERLSRNRDHAETAEGSNRSDSVEPAKNPSEVDKPPE